jgi:hypothetical protein
MRQNKTPLCTIIWQRLLSHFNAPPKWEEPEVKIMKEILRNLVPISRAVLVTIATFLFLKVFPLESIFAWIWIKQTLPGFDNYGALYLAVVLLIGAILAPWFCSLIIRIWSYCLKTQFSLVLAAILVLAIWKSGQAGYIVDPLMLGAWTLFFGTIVFRLWIKEEKTEEISDKLDREHFVNRLFQIFQDPNTNLRRIAILGSWGTGKTVVLKLLRKRLTNCDQPQFGVAMINPWISQDLTEVHKLIGKAFEEALGYHDYFQNPFSRWNWLTSISGVMFGGSTKLSLDLQKLFRAGSSEYEEQLVHRINETLKAVNRICVILIDDMERAEPDVIKKVFPLINILGRIENCFFVFAIDPDRVTRVFGEKARSESETKGYFDKVFDLQFNLPEPRQKDTAALFSTLASQSETPKLFAAAPKLMGLLSSNPRLTLIFFQEVKSREVMFLYRYGPKEKAFLPFFIFWLCETEFRGFADEISKEEPKQLFEVICQTDMFSNRKGKISENVSFHKLISLLSGNLSLSSENTNRLKFLVESLAENAGGIYDWIEDSASPFTLEWAAQGYTKLLELSFDERNRLHSCWVEEAGRISIASMLHNTLGDLKFCEPSRCAEQLIEAEFRIIKNATSVILRPSYGQTSPPFESVSQAIRRLRKHLKFAMKEKSFIDITPFNENFFKEWLKYIDESPLCSVNCIDAEQINKERCSFHFEFAKTLTLWQSYTWATWSIHHTVERYARDDNRSESQQHCDDLKRVLMDQVSDGVIEMFRTGDIPRNWPTKEMPNSTDISFFYRPQNWLHIGTDGVWKRRLNMLLEESLSNPAIAKSCAKLTYHLFLHPATCIICAGNHAQERAEIKQLAADFPDYLDFFWHSTMTLPNDNPERQEALEECARAHSANAESQFLPIELLQRHFPLR